MEYVYGWEHKARTVLEHLHKGRTPEVLLELMLKTGVLEATEEEKKLILSCVYGSTNHVYFGGTWDPMGMIMKNPEDSLREIKEPLDRLVEDGTLTKEFRDKRWEQILKDCSRPNPTAEAYKKDFEHIEALLNAAMK